MCIRDRIWDEPTYNTESPVSLSADGSILVTGSLSGRLRVFGRDPGGEGYSELWHYNFTGANSCWVSTTAVSSDGGTVAAGTLDFYEDHYEGRLALFDTFGRGEPLWIADPLSDMVAAARFSRDGGVLAAVTWGDIENEAPDLALYERHSREPFYTLVSPGSLSALAVSDDGSRILAGGKAVHNRVFGRGGRLYLVEAGYPGAEITGVVSDEDGEPLSGAEVTIAGNPYRALSDDEGNYRLHVEVADPRRVDVIAQRRGFYEAMRRGVMVARGEVTRGVNFALSPTDPPPRNLRASHGVRNVITLRWEPYNGVRGRLVPAGELPFLAAVGETPARFGPTPGDDAPNLPRRDDGDDAQQILIYRSYLPGGPYAFIGAVDGDESRFTDRSRIFPRHRYYYVVTADFGDGESGFSAEAVGWLDDSFLDWELDLEDMPRAPNIDGVIENDEWRGAAIRDISDVFGYDVPDTAGSVSVRIGFDDESNRLFFGFDYFTLPELEDRMGAGVYVDDDGDGAWAYDRPGTEGNYWGYWIDGAPDMRYRSLSGPPYNSRPYYVFENPQLAFSDRDGHVEFEMAVPLGFHGPEEVALYAPDYTIGLGLFTMHRDEDDNPIFNAWWPQDMFSIVSNPDQFARVHVPAHLAVPPQAPDDVWVDRDGDDLSVGWTIPETGIDDGPLEGLAGFELQRNGEVIAELDPDVQEYLDDQVSALGWYEYSVRGYVLENGQPFHGPFSPSIGMYAVEDPDVDVVSYDDGSAEAFYVVAFNGEDNRFAVRFDLDDFIDTLAVYWVDLIANASQPIEVCLAEDEDDLPGDIVGGRFETTPAVPGDWHRFHFPGVEQPRIEIDPLAFNSRWLMLNYLPDSPGAPGIGVDGSNHEPSRYKYYTTNGNWQDFNAGRLMVRIAVGRAPTAAPPDEQPVEPPEVFVVGPNYPNPFNEVSFVPLALPVSGVVGYSIFGVDGRVARSGFFKVKKPGRMLFPVDAQMLNAGSYFLRVRCGAEIRVVKMTVVK